MRCPLPIGYEDFKEVREKNFYYVDKTKMLCELLDSGTKASLLTRPRRFGKTLNLSMIQRFFECERTQAGDPIDNSRLFDDLHIASCEPSYLRHQQQYPVISLSLKSAKQPTYDLAYAMLQDSIAKEYRRHAYVLSGDKLDQSEQTQFTALIHQEGNEAQMATALEFLSACLFKYHGKKTIILIDEYDVPLENAWAKGFYEPMIDFIRSLFESALKTNPALEFAVITGCLRISRESIFTGLNHFAVCSLLSPHYTDSFGFTSSEVKQLLHNYGLEEKEAELKHWYNGYQISGQDIYNPWSILNYIDDAAATSLAFPKPYWSNTSSNTIVRTLVEHAGPETRREIEQLIAGGSIEKPIQEDITYGEIQTSQENLWNFLYFTGYLKETGIRQDEMGILHIKLAIPNLEVRTIYQNTVLNWFGEKVRQADLRPLFIALETGDCKEIGRLISEQLSETISFFDYGESYYHGFLAGLLKASSKYEVLSNRESGEGRWDLVLKEWRFQGRAVILELKVAGSFSEMQEACQKALAQIEKRDYEAALRTEGREEILKYGICFFRKGCMAVKGGE